MKTGETGTKQTVGDACRAVIENGTAALSPDIVERIGKIEVKRGAGAMARPMSYAARREFESLPVVDGRQYRAAEVKLLDDRCPGCAASDNGMISKDLCNALPECTKSKRLDGRNVVFVDCGPAKAAPVIKTETSGRGGVRFEHEGFNVGTMWIHVPTDERVEVVGDGMAGMTEVKFEDGHTIHAFPKDLKPITSREAR